MQGDMDRVTEALAGWKEEAERLSQVWEALQRRAVLVALVLPHLPELARDPRPRARAWALRLAEDAARVDRHGKQALTYLRLHTFPVCAQLLQDPVCRVARHACQILSALLPLALKVCLLDPEAHSLRALLGELEQAALLLVARPGSSPVAAQGARLVHALVLAYLPAPHPAARSPVFDAAELPDAHALLRRDALALAAETCAGFLVSQLGAQQQPGLLAAQLYAVAADLAVARPQLAEHVLPALLQLDPADPLAGARSLGAVERRSAKKALQLACLRLLRTAVAPTWAPQLETSITASGGTKQLEKLRRGNKRGREEYDWDLDGPGAGGAVDDLQQQQLPQQQQQQQPYLPFLPQQPQAPSAPSSFVPEDLELLDLSVLVEVEELLREMSVEQMADIVMENMSVFGAVGSRPGDDGFFELAAARDPRKAEERRARQKAPRVALLGLCEDGLRVPRLDEDGFRRAWRSSVARLLDSELAMRDKGQRGLLVRAALLARLLAGKEFDDEMVRSALLHVTSDLRGRILLALQWLHEELRVEQFMERDLATVKEEKMDLSGDTKEEQDEEAAAERIARDASFRYHFLFMNILDACLPTIDLLQETATTLLLQAPWLPAAALSTLGALAADPQRHGAGLALLGALARARPRYRDAALLLLLRQCAAEISVVRVAAVAAAAALAAAAPECEQPVCAFAQSMFAEAAAASVLNVACDAETFLEAAHDDADTDGGAGEARPDGESEERAREWREQREQLRKLQAEKSAADARRIQAAGIAEKIALLFALLPSRLELLLPVGQAFAHLGPVFRQEVIGMTRVAVDKATEAHKASVQQTEEEKAEGEEKKATEPKDLARVVEALESSDLAMAVVQSALAHGEMPSDELVAACKARRDRDMDVRFLLPVLRSLKYRDVLAEAPRFLSQPKEILIEFVNKAMASAYFIDKPGELVARFLSASASEAGASEETDLLLRQSAAVSVALAHPRMGRDHVAALLRRLAEAVPVHSLFMKTCMQAVQRFPDLVAWLLDNLLPKLIQGLVWKHPVLWKGFVRFCGAALDQGSCGLLVRLPPDAFKSALAEDNRLAPALRRYAKEHANKVPNLLRRVLREEFK